MTSITTAVAVDYRLQQWTQLVKECQNRPSDMTVEQWCDTKGISNISIEINSCIVRVHGDISEALLEKTVRVLSHVK